MVFVYEYRKAYRALFDFLAFLLFMYLLVKPAAAGRAVESGISFCLSVIVPSLFVFLVLSKLFMNRLCASAGKSLPAVLIIGGILCGVPIGAKMTRELYVGGTISKKQAEVLVSSSNNASVSFIMAFAGANVLGSVKAGALLVFGKILLSFLWYAFASRITLPREKRRFAAQSTAKEITLPQAVKDASRTMAEVCASIIFFMCVGETILNFLPSNELLRCGARGFFEFSGGIELCRHMKPETGYIITAMLLGWTGLCVHMQVSLSAGKGIGLKLYFLNKIVESLFMGVFAILTKALAF